LAQHQGLTRASLTPNQTPTRPIKGLYAVGECSCVSVHGANRLGTNSLLDLLVFGKAAGDHIIAHNKPGTPVQDLPANATDLTLARRLYSLVRESGLEDVQYRTFILAVRSQDAMIDYLPSTVESLRGIILQSGLMPESELAPTIAECRAHLQKPGTSFTMYTVAQVWGRKAGG